MSYSGSATWPSAVDRWGHFGSRVLIAAICAAIVLGVHPLPSATLAGVFVPLGVAGVAIVSALLMYAHDRRLCEQCMASLPLNPAQSAAQYERRFAVAHMSAQRRFMIGYLAGLLLSNFLLVSPGSRPSPVALALWGACQYSLVYLILAHTTHRRLQPWCPRCRGGGESLVDTPGPVPSGSKIQ